MTQFCCLLLLGYLLLLLLALLPLGDGGEGSPLIAETIFVSRLLLAFELGLLLLHRRLLNWPQLLELRSLSRRSFCLLLRDDWRGQIVGNLQLLLLLNDW